jgi:hypothetical protein
VRYILGREFVGDVAGSLLQTYQEEVWLGEEDLPDVATTSPLSKVRIP